MQGTRFKDGLLTPPVTAVDERPLSLLKTMSAYSFAKGRRLSILFEPGAS